MSDFDVTIAPPPVLDVEVVPPPAFDLELGAQQGHQGIPGPAGGQLNGIGGAVLNGHRVVAFAADGRLVHASADNLAHVFAIAGVIEHAVEEGAAVPVRDNGAVEFSGWAWAPGPVVLGLDGQLTQALPVGALFELTMGRGDGTRLFLDIQVPIEL